MSDLPQRRRGRGLLSSTVSPRTASTHSNTPRAKQGITNNTSRRGSSQNVLTTTCKHDGAPQMSDYYNLRL